MFSCIVCGCIFDRELRERPDDVDVWMELVKLQDELSKHRTDDGQRVYSQQAILQKKVTILEQAVAKNPSNITLKV